MEQNIFFITQRKDKRHKDQVNILLSVPLKNEILKLFPHYWNIEETEEGILHSFDLSPTSSWLITHMVSYFKDIFKIDPRDVAELERLSEYATPPSVKLENGKKIIVEIPAIQMYKEMMVALQGRELDHLKWTIPVARGHQLLKKISTTEAERRSSKFVPAFHLSEEVKHLLLRNMSGFDGTLESISRIPLSDINAVKKAHKTKMENFGKAGFSNPVDFILNPPRRYIDKTGVVDFSSVQKGDTVSVIATITKISSYGHPEVQGVTPDGLTIQATFWHRDWIRRSFKVGNEVLIVGQFEKVGTFIYHINPHSMDTLEDARNLPIVPVYKQRPSINITSKIIMTATLEIYTRLKESNANISSYMSENESRMSFLEAIQELHFPSSLEEEVRGKAVESLAFYELVYLRLLLLDKFANQEKGRGSSKEREHHGYVQIVKNNLPFELTSSQIKATETLYKCLDDSDARRALLIGDVGSGKSICSQLVCLKTVDAGFQAVLAGPTEILAQQLYETYEEVLALIPEDKRPTLAFLAGSTKAREKKKIFEQLSNGEIDILVGTHTVLNPTTPYKNLGVIVIDEEQKFGAEVREALSTIEFNGKRPDLIMQTATPIPNSTAKVFYGEIELARITDKPKGRLPVETHLINQEPSEVLADKNHPLYKKFREEMAKGHQIFVVVPAVYDNPKQSVASVEEVYKSLAKTFGKEDVVYAHGKLKNADCQEMMRKFNDNEAKILVASIVIEVGIDVPNATVMAVLSADRMGISGLHQLRGRVGRSSIQSYCYLVSGTDKDSTLSRLNFLVESNDGYELALKDLEARGEGNLFSNSQSGKSGLRFANLVDYTGLVDEVEDEAKRIYNSAFKEQALRDAEFIKAGDEDV